MLYIVEMFTISLLLTLLIELPIAWCMGFRKRSEFILAILVNLLTNPVAVLLHWLGIPQIPIEIAVVLTEAGIYLWFSKDHRWKISHPILLSILANLVSWIIGALIS